MEKLMNEIRAAKELLESRTASRYKLTAAELLMMIEAENKGRSPVKESTSKDALFNAILDAYHLGFQRGQEYQKSKEE